LLRSLQQLLESSSSWNIQEKPRSRRGETPFHAGKSKPYRCGSPLEETDQILRSSMMVPKRACEFCTPHGRENSECNSVANHKVLFTHYVATADFRLVCYCAHLRRGL